MAASTGVDTFRMGVDWGRLTPFQPGSLNCDLNGLVYQRGDAGAALSTNRTLYPCRSGVQDLIALRRYGIIIEMVRNYGMRVMLTLFHHSLPKWANEKRFAGWTNPQTVDYFLELVRDVVPTIQHHVDMYVIFNEPAVYASLVYALNMWPGRMSDKLDVWAYFNMGTLKGTVVRCYENMAKAHSAAYTIIKQLDKVKADTVSTDNALVTVAHNMAKYAAGPPWFISSPVAAFLHNVLNLQFLDMIQDDLDMIGVNYYGQEYITTRGAALLSNAEYSESGRSISPDGFFEIISLVHDRYNVRLNRSLPIIITENGISDSTDVLRPSYLIEHLLAIEKAITVGIPVTGYLFWTISDNMEWADGYCPKFGLLAVDRASKDLRRTARYSYGLFSDIVKGRNITLKQRVDSWNHVIYTKGIRPFCRSYDGKETVHHIAHRRFSNVDWRFSNKLDMFPKRWPF